MSRARALSVSSGFLLHELVIVIAIIAALALVLAPVFGKIRRRAELRGAAMEIGTTLLAARVKAVRHNSNTSIVITPASAGQEHRFDTVEPPPPTPVANPDVPLFLSSNSFRFVTLPAGNTITFDAEGRRVAPPSPTPGTIVIEGPTGSPVTNQITIDTSSGGRVKIVTPTVWQ